MKKFVKSGKSDYSILCKTIVKCDTKLDKLRAWNWDVKSGWNRPEYWFIRGSAQVPAAPGLAFGIKFVKSGTGQGALPKFHQLFIFENKNQTFDIAKPPML